MERNNSEIGEVLAYLTLMNSMTDGHIEFGDRLDAKKYHDGFNISYIGDADVEFTECHLSLSKLTEIHKMLYNELLQKKSMRGEYEYYGIHLLVKELGCPENMLFAPAGRIDDFILNGRVINFKGAIQNKAGILHYSRNFAFEFDIINITDVEAKEIQRQIQAHECSPDIAVKQLIQMGKIRINPNSFCGAKENEVGFGEFLAQIDPELPYVYQHIKYLLLETGIHYPHLLLNEHEFEIFKKLVKQMNGGLNTTNFYDFKPVTMDLIIMDRNLNMLRKDLSTDDGVDWMARHLYIDVGDASRTGSGKMRKENETWKIVEGMYFKYEAKDRN